MGFAHREGRGELAVPEWHRNAARHHQAHGAGPFVGDARAM
jgi:hypothetical protein